MHNLTETVPEIENFQVFNVMELCSGVGGTGFLGQRQKMHGKEVELQVRWAFDINEDASAAYQINDPACEVYVRGIDESLMLSKVRVWIHQGACVDPCAVVYIPQLVGDGALRSA